MADRVTVFLKTLADRLTAGPLEAITQLHSYPLPVQVGDGGFEVMASAAHHQAFLLEHRALLAAKGVRRIVAEIGGIEVSHDSRGRAWVRWLRLGPGDRVLEEVPSVVYLRRFPDGDLRIEMVHFLTSPMPPDVTLSLRRSAALLEPDIH